MAFCTRFVCMFFISLLKLLFMNDLRWLKSVKESDSFASSVTSAITGRRLQEDLQTLQG